MRKFVVSTLRFINYLFKSLLFVLYSIIEHKRFGNYHFPYREDFKGHSVFIFANGPSLNEEIDDLKRKGLDLSESLVVNFFANTDLFEQIKPKYYCLADPAFFVEPQKRSERINLLLNTINSKVSWPMTVFVWKLGEQNMKKEFSNKSITIEPLSILRYEGFPKLRNILYKKGWAVPLYVNVTIMAIYALLNLGFDTIKLYGVDHSFLRDLCVNDDNQLCINDHHFYGTQLFVIPPRTNGAQWKMKDFVYDKYLTFLEHEHMREYADYLGAQIINCTKDSWIDAYTRLSQLKKQDKP